MPDVFIKKYWSEENTLFYLHFSNGEAIRQIEVVNGMNVFLSSEHPHQGASSLYDQSLEELDLDESDFITASEFENIWGNP